jgi:hypothetical protein
VKRYLILVLLGLLTGCGTAEVVTTEDISTVATTETQTEVVTTELVTEAPTTEKKTTEGKTEIEFELVEMVSEEDYILIEVESVTEESTGEINVDGYGWVQLQYSAPYHIMDGHLTRPNGSINVFGHHETWYSTNESCGQATARDIPGKHVADDGTIRDADGYICVASSDLSFYSIVMTSVGPGKVYDCGCSHGTIDVYTNW